MRDGVDAPLASDACEPRAFLEVPVDASDVDVADRTGGHDGKVLLDLVGDGNHLLGRQAQLLARLGELYAVRLTHEELLPELLLEVLELSGEGGLAYVQARGGIGDAAFLGRQKEVSEYAQLHGFPTFLI